MSNRRQMYTSRYSAMQSVPNNNFTGITEAEPQCSVTDCKKMEQNCECVNQAMPYMMNGMGNSHMKHAYCNKIKEDFLAGVPLAMAYVPWQKFENLYDEHVAFQRGTIFKDLDLDFYGRRCK